MLKRWLSGALALILAFGLFAMLPPRASAATVLTTSDALVTVLKKMEGFSAKPYWDYAQYTVGYGTKCPDDKLAEYQANGITREEAEALLVNELKKTEKAINEFTATYGLVLKQNEFDALVSFSYNCGTGWTKEASGYFNLAVRSGDKSNAFLYALCLWSTAGGEYILIDRRMCEANMYINGEYRAPNSGGTLYPDNFRWVFLDGNGGTVRYKIHAYDANNPQPIDISFTATPTYKDANGNTVSYTFAGWYTAAGTKITKLTSALTCGQTLMAKWKEASGKIVDVTQKEEIEETIQVTVTGDVVNIRSGAGTGYDVVDTAQQGDTFTVTEVKESDSYTWGKISSGWICLNYTNYSSAPLITRQPSSVTVPAGETATVSVSAKGTGLTYRWYFRNAGATKFSKSSITTSSYSVSMDSSRNGRSIYCVITDNKGNSITSQTVSLYMGNPLKITQQPTNKSAAIGSTISIALKAAGDGLKYQWYYCNLGSSTYQKSALSSSTYRTQMAQTCHGRKLYCVVTDKYGSTVRSDTITISSTTAIILTQPANTETTVGKTATLQVKAAGNGLKYQWYIRNAGAKKFTKSALTTKNYSVTMTSAVDGRQAYCIVTDSAGNQVKSATATLTLSKDFFIDTQPATVVTPKGEYATLRVLANGEGLRYSWYIRNPGETNFSKSSITTDTYRVEMNASRNGRQAYCVITNAAGKKLTTNTVTMYIDNSLFITQQPQDATAVNGQKVSIQVEANGAGLTYQWYIRSPGQKNFAKSSVTTKTYQVEMNASRDGREAYCVITDALGGTLTSEIAKLTMTEAITITTQPKDTAVPLGQKATVAVKAEGNDLTYAWYYTSKGSSTFYLSSIQTSSYSVTMDASRHNRRLYCIITDCYGNTKKTETVTIKSSTVVITKQPENVSAAVGQKATFTVTAEGEGLTYAWYICSPTGTKFSKSSITTASYSVNMTASRNGRRLYCIVTDAAGNQVKSNTVTLTLQ